MIRRHDAHRHTRAQRRWGDSVLPISTAPLFHTLQMLATSDSARFHMPGHKGEPVFSSYADVFAIDFTETYGTGNLYEGEGPIREAEIAAARYFHAEDCFFLTGGSTQGILAMLAAAAGEGGAVLLDRGCHKSVCHGCALLDLTPYFIGSDTLERFHVPAALHLREAEEQLRAHPEIRALLLTSPNYYGVCRDVEAFAALCRRYGVKLLVDAAHGAHFPAVGLPTPVEQGADMAVLSIHKTLPALGQSSVLLMRKGTDRRALREFTALFGTSSPSYPIMASTDLARAYMEGRGREAYLRAAESCAELRQYVNTHTKFHALTTDDFAELDPCRLTVCTDGANLTGHQLADRLWSGFGVACEMADGQNVVFILTGMDAAISLYRLRRALRRISQTCAPAEPAGVHAAFPPANRVSSVRQAWFSKKMAVPVRDAAGLVCARPVTPYPPGVPLLWPGEKITPAHVELLTERWYNEISEIQVVIP